VAEAVVSWVATAVVDAIGFEAAAYVFTAAPYVLAAGAVYTLRDQQRSAQNRAKDAYNASLKDRYVMQRSATQQRQMVLGRMRVSGPVAFLKSFGASSANLAFIVALAAHEVDAIETVYFDDTPLVLDGSGNVVATVSTERFSLAAASASYTLTAAAKAGTVTAVVSYDTGDVTLTTSLSGDGLTVTVSGGNASKIGAVAISYQPSVCIYTPSSVYTATASVSVVAGDGSGSYTAPVDIVPNSASAVSAGSINDSVSYPVTVSGRTISFTGATPGASVNVSYQYASTGSSRARIRKYLGAPGQAADGPLQAALPTYWTSNHVGAGIAYLVVELDYDPDSFPGGVPNVSAVVRGLKCYDPRTGTTAWTQNPALLMRGYWTHPLGANRSASQVDDTSVIAAANACDAVVSYKVGNNSYRRATYRADTVAARDRRPQDVLNDLAQAMGGRWVVGNNTLRVRAGSYVAPVAAIDETWLHDGSAVQVQPRRGRADLINATTGTFADETQDWQTQAYPKVVAAAYVTVDGRELATDINYPAVTFSGQAQFLSQAQIRYARAGLTVKMSCNLRAYPLEVFDVVSLSLARFGWVSKTFEVIETGFSIDGLIDLTLKEIDASIWTLDAQFLATDFARKTTLPNPWLLTPPTLNTPASGTSHLLRLGDGTIISRIYVSWPAVTDPSVLQGGQIEVQAQRVGDTTGTWLTATVPGDATNCYLSPVQDGAAYLIRARSTNNLSASDWSVQKTHIVVGKLATPATPTGLAYTVSNGSLRATRTPSTEVDYDRTLWSYGTTYASRTPVPGTSDASGLVWPWPPLGSYNLYAEDVDTSGNASGAAVLAVSVTAAALYLTSGNINPPAEWLNANVAIPRGTLNADPGLLDEANAWVWDAGIFVDGPSTASGALGVKYFTALTAGEKWAWTKQTFPISSARTYNLSALLYAAAGNARSMYLVVDMYKADGTRITGADTGWGGLFAGYTFGGLPTPGQFTRYGDASDFGAGTARPIPAAAAYFRVGVWFQYADGSGGVQQAAEDIRLVDVTDARVAATTALWPLITGTGKPADLATRNDVYRQSTDPGAVANGSIWLNTSTGRAYQRVEGTWQAYVGDQSVDTPQLADYAATEVYQTSATNITVTGQTGVPAGSFTDLISISFTPGVSGDVLITSEGSATITTPASGAASAIYASLSTRVTVNGTQIGPLRTYARDDDVGYSRSVNAAIVRSRRISVTAGVAYTVVVQAQKLDPDVSTIVTDIQLRVEVIQK